MTEVFVPRLETLVQKPRINIKASSFLWHLICVIFDNTFFLRDFSGTVRDVCCSPDGRWIAFGFSTGLASVLDIRGGLLRSQRRAHTGDILQV